MRSDAFWAHFDTIRAQLGVRAESFARIFEHLDKFDHPLRIIETGCASKPDDWTGDGGSTILFDKYAEFHPEAVVHSIDIDPDTAARCRTFVSERIRIHVGDSVCVLKSLADAPPEGMETLDLLYLDSHAVDYEDVFPGAFHCMMEFIASGPLICSDTLVAVDDAPPVFSGAFDASGKLQMATRSTIGGNGKLIAQYAYQIGAEICFIGQQCGWTKLKANKGRLAAGSPYLRAAVTASPQGIFAAGIEDEHIGKALRERGESGMEEVARATKLLSPDDRVLIVGAHIGTLAIPLARHCRHVTAIEANPITHRYLAGNIAMNGATNITALNFAAGDKTETIEFVTNTDNSGGSKRMPLVRDHTYFYDNPSTVKVEAYSLDTKLEGEKYAFVLMDIEGSEYFALKGMPNILQNARALVIEFIPHLLRNVSGVTPEEFAAVLQPHFGNLHIFATGQNIAKDQFAAFLRGMYDRDESDCGLLFKK